MSELSKKKCIPCNGDVPSLTEEEVSKLLPELEEWKVFHGHHLEKEYSFPNFAEALTFVNKVGAIAEEEGHHPNIFFTWGEVKLSIWTHKVNGITEADFVLASKIDLISK